MGGHHSTPNIRHIRTKRSFAPQVALRAPNVEPSAPPRPPSASYIRHHDLYVRHNDLHGPGDTGFAKQSSRRTTFRQGDNGSATVFAKQTSRCPAGRLKKMIERD